MTKALYVGSFDPFTLGHADIVRQALLVFDEVDIRIGTNPKKMPLFTLQTRGHLIGETIKEAGLDYSRCRGSDYKGSMMAEARKSNATAIVRGLRQISDFGDEFTINGMVARAIPDIPVAYFICRQDFLHVSSSSVKEMAMLGEDISWMVSPTVEKHLMRTIQTFE
jgi:pantetheine-phosphate adenylyltransferase